jgi:predicted TIM-barrel fold metal-dependent hydrolase
VSRTLYADVTAGRPVEALFIDVHGHFGSWPETTIPWSRDAARVLAAMDRCGCDQVWMTAANPGYSGDLSAKNDEVFTLADHAPDRVLPYCTLSANTPERCLPELRRCLGRGRCVGVKMHVYQQPPYSLRSAWLQPVLEELSARRLVYLNHTLFSVEELEWAADRYPDITFVAGHFWPAANDVATRRPNVKDCTCAAMAPGALEHEVRRLGRSDTLLVGSDFALFALAFGFGMLAYAELSETDKRNILGLNALRIIRRIAWSPELRFRKPLPAA